MSLAVAYQPITMPDLSVWYGSLLSYTATNIVLSDGNRAAEYIGSFTYDIYGNVYGILNEFRATTGGVLQYSVSAMTVDANQAFVLVNVGHAEAVAQLFLAGNDNCVGSFGADRVHAYGGNDTIHGNGGWDVVFGDGGNDVLFGGAGNDRLYGGNGNDRLQGDAGNDLLNGGAGIDTAVFAGAVATNVNLALAAGTAQNTGHGIDRLAYIENVISGSGADVLRGNGLANMLSGNAGNDRLYGAGGNDRLYGSYGNDRLQGDAGNDVLNGGAGIDTAVFTGAIATTVNLALAAGTAQNTGHGIDRLAYIENVISGSCADVLRGNGLANMLLGNAGNDRLYGAGGNDSLYGSYGNDRLYGDAGDDLLDSGAGNDLLGGGAGADRLIGGLGADSLYGGAGADVFVFNSAAEIGSGAARDTVADFVAGQDLVDLSAMTLSFIGGAGFSHAAGELRFVTGATGGFLLGDTDGNGAADFVLFLHGVAAITAGDMIL